jgi:hypothetical protein
MQFSRLPCRGHTQSRFLFTHLARIEYMRRLADRHSNTRHVNASLAFVASIRGAHGGVCGLGLHHIDLRGLNPRSKCIGDGAPSNARNFLTNIFGCVVWRGC